MTFDADDSARVARWQSLLAPDLDDIAALGQQAFNDLPAEFRSLCGDLEIRVDDFADDDTLDALSIESEFDLLGLFQGTGLAQADAIAATGTLPNRIWLYRRPILDYWAEHEESLSAVVTHVLVHEIGHHFGLSDEDIDLIEASA